MMFKTWFYDNRQLLALAISIIVVGGASALFSLPRLEDPRIKNRNPLIVTLLPGASAERVEALVTKKLEEELREVAEIKELESDSRVGVSLIAIELDDRVSDTDSVFTNLRDKLADVESELPPEASKPDFDDERGAVAFTLIVGVTWESESPPPMSLLTRTAEELADRLRNVGGTDLVRLYGDVEEEITVTISHDKIAQLGLSVGELQSMISEADAKVPAGMLRSNDQSMVMEVRGDFKTTARISDIPIRSNQSGEVLRLSDIATVEKSWRTPAAELGWMDGKRTVYVAARMQDDRRVDRWMSDAKAVTETFRQSLSPNLELTEVFDQSNYTNQRLTALGINLLLGAGVVVLVILFMMGWRSSLLVGLSLPLVSAMVLFGLLVLGIPLHQMSIFGLIVALGLLIDNAIVVVDDVATEMRTGHSPRSAIAKTVGHLFVPLLGSTLTTVVAFLPIFLLPGSLGEFVSPIATTVILALIFSFFVSMTVIPAVTGIFHRAPAKASWWHRGVTTPRLSRLLARLVGYSVRYPLIGILFAAALPLIGFLRFGDLRDQFFPSSDRNQFHIQVWLPRDSAIESTSRTAMHIESAIRESEGVEHVNWLVGGSVPTIYYNMLMNQDEKPSYAEAVITARDPEQARRLIVDLQAKLDRRFPHAQAVVKQLGQGPPVDAPVEVRVYGPNIDRLREIGQDMQRMLIDSPEVLHTRTTIDSIEPKLWVEADEVEARFGGLTLSDLSRQLQANLEGSVGGSVLEETEELPVRIRFSETFRSDLSQIASSRILLPNDQGWTSLAALGQIRLEPETSSIPRRNGERCNTIKAYVERDALPPEVTAMLLRKLEEADYQLPPGYRMEIGGDAEELATAMGNLFRYAPVLGVVMLATVVLSFRSFLLAAILGMVAAMSAGLAFLTLWVAGFPLGFNPLIGTAGLIGIALNDSIVVLAQIRSSERARQGNITAIVDEVMKTSRHVLSTTLTTIGGFVPLLLSGGDFWPPLAIVIAGGVGGASVLALFFVPASYTLMRPFVESNRSTMTEQVSVPTAWPIGGGQPSPK